jgi:hypothetical protein
MYRSTYSWYWQQLEVSGQFHSRDVLPPSSFRKWNKGTKGQIYCGKFTESKTCGARDTAVARRRLLLARASSNLLVSQLLILLRVAVMRSKKPLTEVEDSSGTRRRGNIRCWKPLPINGYWRVILLYILKLQWSLECVTQRDCRSYLYLQV